MIQASKGEFLEIAKAAVWRGETAALRDVLRQLRTGESVAVHGPMVPARAPSSACLPANTAPRRASGGVLSRLIARALAHAGRMKNLVAICNCRLGSRTEMEAVSNSGIRVSYPERRWLGGFRRNINHSHELPVSHSKPPGRFYDFCRVLWLGIFKCTMRVKTSGLESLTNVDGGVLIAVSHVSHLDPVVVSALLGRRISWVSRIEFYRQSFMRCVLYHGGAFRVDRAGHALPTIREGLKRLNRGEAVGIFPEGEVMKGENSLLRGAPVKRGVCLLAARSGCPVVPVVVLGTDRLTRVGPWLPAKRGRLWLMVGRPLQAREGGHTKAGRAEFAVELEVEFVKLFAEVRREFGLPESIVP